MGDSKINVAVLISGNGSNLQALIDACVQDNFPARISVVVSNKPDAYGLTRAKDAGIPALLVDHTEYTSKQDFEQAILDALALHSIDLICLAGFMRVLSPHFINAWQDRLVNIHPSLLPKHKGLNTHARAIESGDAEAGCTIHHVVPEIDSGTIIAQESVPIDPNETPETLAKKVQKCEHILYPKVLERLAKEIRAK